MTTDIDYRTGIRAYANSDLGELARIRFGKPAITASQATLDFGTAFHTLILEPGKFDAKQHENIYPIIACMRESVTNEPGVLGLICSSDHEVVRQWIDPATDLPCKAKLDGVVKPRESHLFDLKSTSCRSKADFLQSCYDYDYDRQAAFYLRSDPEKAKFFTLLGVQKQPPYQLFILNFHKSDEFIRGGMKKAERLLRLAKETGFVPGSWH